MKKSLFILLVLSSFSVYSQDCTVTGVVTYFFNQYQGNKPDIGAKVYLIDATSNNEFDDIAINEFLQGKYFFSSYIDYSNKINEVEEKLKIYGRRKKQFAELIKSANERGEFYRRQMAFNYNKMVEYNVETEEKLGELDKKIFQSYYTAISKDNVISRTINANGDYSIQTNAGSYYVLIISKNRTGSGASEVEGKLFCTKIQISKGQTKDVSYNFGIR